MTIWSTGLAVIVSIGHLVFLDVERTRLCQSRDDIRHSWTRIIYLSLYTMLVTLSLRIVSEVHHAFQPVQVFKNNDDSLASSQLGADAYEQNIFMYLFWSIANSVIITCSLYAGTLYWTYANNGFSEALRVWKTNTTVGALKEALKYLKMRFIGRNFYDSWVAYKHSISTDIQAVATLDEVDIAKRRYFQSKQRSFKVNVPSLQESRNGSEFKVSHCQENSKANLNCSIESSDASLSTGGALYLYHIESESYRRNIPRCEVLLVDDALRRFKVNIIVPVTEELVFRYVVCKICIALGDSLNVTAFTSAIVFATLHLFDPFVHYVKGRLALKTAALRGLVYFSYTSLFGLYSSYLYLRTNSILTCIVSHFICNIMSLPDLEAFTRVLEPGKVDSAEVSRVWRARVIHVIGIFLFFVLFAPLTSSYFFFRLF